jgi:hypothetical protein
MFSKSNSSLIPSSKVNISSFYSQSLLPLNALFDFHYKSTPNVAIFFDDQVCMNKIFKLINIYKIFFFSS